MVDKSIFFETDCGSIQSQIKHQEEQLQLKRRLLLSFPVSDLKHEALGRFLPESLLREDDISYETIKSHVEKAFGICKKEEGCNVAQENDSVFHAQKVIRFLDMNLDALTNKGLYLIVLILTGGSITIEKTRQRMKGIIRDRITKSFRNKMHDDAKANTFRQLHQVLNAPGNFRKSCMTSLFPTFRSHHDDVVNVLNQLESLSSQTLFAMKRKLKGTRTIPRLESRKSGQSRIHLIKQVREACEKMLSELVEDDELQEPLAKAMGLFDLAIKLNPGYKSASAASFYEFSPEIKSLQNEIVMAIWLLHKVRFPELKRLQLLLDPEADVSNDSLRSSIRKMLTEYLFECSDMDTIPNSLLKALSLVNRGSRSVEHKVFPEEAVEEEVEFILNMSAQTKEIFWQWLPNYELDQNFSDVYMEELEDSDDENSSIYGNDGFCAGDNLRQKAEVRDTQDNASDSSDPDHEESIAECSGFESRASTYGNNHYAVCASDNRDMVRGLTESVTRVCPASPYVFPVSNESRFLHGRCETTMNKCQVKIEWDEAGDNIGTESENQFGSSSFFSIERIKTDQDEQKPGMNQNLYLTVQEVSDETSMVAHNLVGHLLDKFAEVKGLDLDSNERSYLVGNFGLQGRKDNEGKPTSLEDKSNGSILIGTVKDLLPSLKKSVLVRLEELMDTS